MRYWLDTEFIEDGKTIDLVSIGMVAEGGRTYYAQSTEFAPIRASKWVRENVLLQLRLCRTVDPNFGDTDNPYDEMLYSLRGHKEMFAARHEGRCEQPGCPWRSREQIKSEILAFCDPAQYGGDKPEFWGYYADYDWVALCQLFGTMMDLPKGWPMYCRDLKQWADDLGNPKLPEQKEGEHNALQDALWNRLAWEFLTGYEKMRAPA